MAINSAIEWTNATWNPLTGCTKVSAGCRHCYAERMAARLQAMGQPNYANGFQVTMHRHVLDLPLRWKKPQTIFVNSMSDLFHEDVPVEFIFEVFGIIRRADWHVFQLLTKRSLRLLELSPSISWPSNLWLGVTVENDDYTSRIDHLRQSRAAVKFLSLEPLLGPVSKLALEGIHWVIAGGESGPKARAIDPEWVAEIRDQCQQAGVPFFFKQWGGPRKKKSGRELDGRVWDEMPAVGGLSRWG